MRYDSPLQLFERTATEDVEIGGVTVRPGQKIAALLGAANRDPAVFADPDRFDVGRADNPHIWPSAPASTSASARRWPGSSCRPRSRRCCAHLSRRWSSPPPPPPSRVRDPRPGAPRGRRRASERRAAARVTQGTSSCRCQDG